MHNVVFTGSPSPAFCQQTVGPFYAPTTVDPNTTPPLPDNVTVYGWVGSCRFDAPGTYAFVCGTHPEMTGSVIVQASSDADAVSHRVADAVPDRVADAVPDGIAYTVSDARRLTPSPTASPTPSPTASPTPSPTASPTPSPTASPTPTATASPTPAPTPDTTITSGPTGPTNNASPSFAFTATIPASTFECKLDGPGAATGTYASCTTPRAYTSLADGTYTFSVRATNSGSTDQSPATRSFTVDTAAPQTTIDTGPTGPTGSNAPSFAFSSSETPSTFECKLDGPGATTGTYASCTSPRAYSALADGTYTFSVRATDAAANVDATPATRSFTVDTVAPQTTIDSGPTGPTGSNCAVVRVLGERAPSTFQCKLDGPGAATGTYATCTVAAGLHRAGGRDVHVLGPRDRRRRERRSTPATRSFTVDTAAPQTTINTGPTGPTGEQRSVVRVLGE